MLGAQTKVADRFPGQPQKIAEDFCNFVLVKPSMLAKA